MIDPISSHQAILNGIDRLSAPAISVFAIDPRRLKSREKKGICRQILAQAVARFSKKALLWSLGGLKFFTKRAYAKFMDHTAPHSLSLRELLALLLSPGSQGKRALGLADKFLSAIGNDERALYVALEADLIKLQSITGFGKAMQSRLIAALELGRRYAIARERERVSSLTISLKASDLEKKALSMIDPELQIETHEWFGFCPIYRNGSVGNNTIVARGQRTHVSIDPQDLFLKILSLRPVGVILFHNHPSGDLTPSTQDYQLTKTVTDIASNLGITVVAHWILGPTGGKRM